MSDGTLGTPVFVTLSEAARRTGLSKSTISRKVRNGEISVYEKGTDGFRIDPSELLRYVDATRVQRAETRSGQADETARTATETLEARLAAAETHLADVKTLTAQQVGDLRALVEDLRGERDHWRALAERLALPTPQPEPRGWRWWRRRAG